MSRKQGYTTIPTDYVRFYLMDGDGKDLAGNGDATITNGTFTPSDFSYIEEKLDFGATTTFTYDSVTYTNSYLIKDGEVLKNSSEVSATALTGASGSSYYGLFLFNKTLTTDEENQIKAYAKRNLGPNRSQKINSAGVYSLPNLENWKVLEISKAKNGSTYYDQTGGGNNSNSIINVTDSNVGKANAMDFNGVDSVVNIPSSNDIDMDTDSFTVALFFNTSNFVSGARLFCKGGDIRYEININIVSETDHRIAFSIDDDITKTIVVFDFKTGPLGDIEDGKWHMVTCQRDYGNLTKIKVDLSNWITFTDATGSITNTLDAQIGTNSFYSTPFWDGKISNVLIYKRLLSDKEIQQLYYSQKANFI